MAKEDLSSLLASIFKEHLLISATLSSPHAFEQSPKVTIRPVEVKGKRLYQCTWLLNQQAMHENLTAEKCLQWMSEKIPGFKQSVLYTRQADYHILTNKKGLCTILKKPPSKTISLPVHNKPKHYLLEEGKPISFLIELGIMNQEGKIYPQKYDKFRQLNRFLEMVEDVLVHLPSDRPLRIIDFGCGKAYLTFALYDYLHRQKGYNLHVTGLDLKQEVIKECQQLAQTLGYRHLHFQLGDINAYQTQDSVDMVISLHACDTATDAALEKAIRWQAKVILCVPCCQHELFDQIQQPELLPLLKHGILKERFAALATDAARAQLLEALGYQAQVLEFIDLEHTPKNLLIRAIKKGKGQKKAWEAYLAFKQALHIDPSLERRFFKELKQL